MGQDPVAGQPAVNWIAVAIGGVLGVVGVGYALATGAMLGWVLALSLPLGVRFVWRPGPRDGRLLAKSAAGVVAVLALLFATMVAVWESAEVMVLHHLDEQGESFGTRLWVIDLEGTPSFAAGADSRRVALLRQHPEVVLERGGSEECRRARVLSAGDAHDDATRRRYEALGEQAERAYEEKYGFRLAFASPLIELLFGLEEPDPVLVRLEPCAEAPAR